MSVKSSLDTENKQEEQAPIETAGAVKKEETKVEETKVEETKVEETKVEETKVEETKVEETKVEAKTPEKGDDTDEIAGLKETIKDLGARMDQMSYRIVDQNPQDRVKVRGVEQLDPKDMLDEPVIFFAFLSSYEMYGYTKNGVEILTPYGRPIRFQFHTRYERPSKSGKGMDSICVSKAVLHSKLEVSWIKSHPDYDVRIHDDASKVASVDITMHQKMGEFASQIANLDNFQLISRAKAEGLTVIQDVVLLRKQVIQKLTDDEVAANRQRMKDEVQEMADIRAEKKELQMPTTAPVTAPAV